MESTERRVGTKRRVVAKASQVVGYLQGRGSGL